MRITIEIDSAAAGNVRVVDSTPPPAAPSGAAEMAVGAVSSLQLIATSAGPAPTRAEADGVATAATPGAPAVGPGGAFDAATSAGAAPQ